MVVGHRADTGRCRAGGCLALGRRRYTAESDHRRARRSGYPGVHGWTGVVGSGGGLALVLLLTAVAFVVERSRNDQPSEVGAVVTEGPNGRVVEVRFLHD